MTEQRSYEIMLETFKLSDSNTYKAIFHMGWISSESKVKATYSADSNIRKYSQEEARDFVFSEELEELRDNMLATTIFNSAWRIAEEDTTIKLSSSKTIN